MKELHQLIFIVLLLGLSVGCTKQPHRLTITNVTPELAGGPCLVLGIHSATTKDFDQNLCQSLLRSGEFVIRGQDTQRKSCKIPELYFGPDPLAPDSTGKTARTPAKYVSDWLGPLPLESLSDGKYTIYWRANGIKSNQLQFRKEDTQITFVK